MNNTQNGMTDIYTILTISLGYTPPLLSFLSLSNTWKAPIYPATRYPPYELSAYNLRNYRMHSPESGVYGRRPFSE